MLTSKLMGKNSRVPLAGIPYHSLERHLATLIGGGYRVAICEQLTDAPVKGQTAGGRGLIERDVVRIVTPGTVIEPGLLHSKANNFLAAYVTDGRRSGIAYADVTTGDFAATELEQAAAASAELERIAPAETLVPQKFSKDAGVVPGFITRRQDASFEYANAKQVLLKHFGTRTLAPYGLAHWPLATAAAGALIAYLKETQGAAAEGLTRLTSYHTESFMMLDQQTVRSLEIFDSSNKQASLLQTLDRTHTAMGGRLLRRWLRQPLLEAAEITRRYEHVAWLSAHHHQQAELAAALESMHDLERLASRTRAGLVSAGELLALGQSLEAIPRVRVVLSKETKRFSKLLSELPSCETATRLIRTSIADTPSRTGEEHSGIIRQGFSEELDRLRTLLRNGRTYLAEMEQRERLRTGIRSLRVGFNKVFGHYIEVTKPNLHLVPDDYTRKQTLAGAERFITLELKEYESLVVHAQERIIELEKGLFRHVCLEVSKSRDDILRAAAQIAYLDVTGSFAEAAKLFGYVRPTITDDDQLHIKSGRHPVLERALAEKSFISNDTALGGETHRPRIALITGPNMSGKSTYLRQTALIVLMAQIGCFVPASEAVIGLCDRIFTRIGLYDRIGSGESTFMTEMVETAQILHHATPRSLILLDELGRGTSTYDGLAVARAIVEHIHNHPQLGSKTLFATHYHELTELEKILPRVKNFHVEIAEQGSDLVFLYKVNPGTAEHSYGVYAARLAGLPKPVIRRAERLLSEYEAGGVDAPPQQGRAVKEKAASSGQDALSASTAPTAEEGKIRQALLDTDPNTLSPVEALMILFELRRLAEVEAGNNVRAMKTA